MKYVKFLITALLTLFCFIMSSEFYQLHLQSFSNQYYFLSIGTGEREEVAQIVVSAAEEYNEHVFAFEREDIDALNSRLIIYADEETISILAQSQDIVEGEAESFFSGSTEVIFLPFSEVAGNASVTTYYFTGTKDTASSIRLYIYSQVATSYIHMMGSSVTDYLIYIIWVILFGFTLVLTWLDIQFSKKSDFLRLSMGGSCGRIILEKILIDAVFYVVILSLAYICLKDIIYLDYEVDFVLYAFIVFVIFNSLLYLTLLKVDYKEVMYGANINGKLLSNTYVLQAVVIILMIVSLSSTLLVIRETQKELQPYDTIEQLSGYASLSITTTDSLSEEEMDQLRTRIYLEAYLQDKVLLSTYCAGLEEDGDYIVVLNEAAVNKVVSNPEIFEVDSDADFIVYIPESRYAELDDYYIEFATYTTASNFSDLQEYSYKVCEYEHVDVVYFDLREMDTLSYGSDLVSDPVIVYCNLSKERINEMLENNAIIGFGDRWANVFIDASDISFLSENVTDEVEDIKAISVVDQCNQYKASLMRTVLLNTIVSVFLFALNIVLILVIVKMEYLVNSKQLALKKIFGYSLWQRNIEMLSLNALSTFIAFVTGFILVKMYDVFDVGSLIVVSLVMLLVNSSLIMMNMTAAERHNTANILKGGSL